MRIGFAFDLSQIWEHSVKDKRFGIVSAYKSELTEAENEGRAKLMKEYVRRLGYGYKEIYGVWKSEDGTATIEYPLFIPNLSREDAIFLGNDAYLPEDKRHPQETVIVGDGTEILLLKVTSDSVEKQWTQMEVGWREMWGEGGRSEYKGKEWRYSSVIWNMQGPITDKNWYAQTLREKYDNPLSVSDWDREWIKERYGLKRNIPKNLKDKPWVRKRDDLK